MCLTLKCFFPFILLVEISVGQIAITDVNLIPMNSNEILTDQTLFIENDKIKALGNTNDLAIPSGSTLINGKGKYLVPGFINMYTHVNESNLLLYLANGQTTVRDIPSHINVLGLRDQIASGQMIGPTILAYGLRATGAPAPFHTQQPIFSAAQGRAQVREAKRLGYDGLFIYATCDPESYQAILDEAEIQELPISGHFPIFVDVDRVLSGKQMEFDNLTGLTRSGKLQFDKSEFIAKLRKQGKAITPSLAVHYKWSIAHKNDSLFEQESMDFIPNKLKALWEPEKKNPNPDARYPYKNVSKLIKELSDHGIQLFLGSDGGYPLVVPGFAYLNEMELFSKAGINNYDVLKFATKDAADFLHLKDVGTIEPGKVADLVLLEDNPLDDIQNASKIEGLFVKGKWLSKNEIKQKLDHLKRNLSKKKYRFDNWQSYLNLESGSKVLDYTFYTNSYEVGAQKIILDSLDAKRAAIKSVMVADSPDFRETYSYHLIVNNRVDSLYILNKGGEGITEAYISRKKDSIYVNGHSPYHGAFSYHKFASPGSQLWAPFISRYFELDNAVNYFLATYISKPLNLNEADQFEVFQIELNSEEFGEAYILDKSLVTVYKTEHGDYRVIYPGFSGYQNRTSLPFNVTVKTDTNNLPEEISYQNQKIHINR